MTNTQYMCTSSSIAIVLIVLFVITPLSNIYLFAALAKLTAIGLLLFAIYVNLDQIKYLRNTTVSEGAMSQLSINIISSYMYTLFMMALIICIIRTFF